MDYSRGRVESKVWGKTQPKQVRNGSCSWEEVRIKCLVKFGNPLHVGCWVSQILLALPHSRSLGLLKGSMIFDTDINMIFIPITGCCFVMSGPLESPSILTASSLSSAVMEEECRVPEKSHTAHTHHHRRCSVPGCSLLP